MGRKKSDQVAKPKPSAKKPTQKVKKAKGDAKPKRNSRSRQKVEKIELTKVQKTVSPRSSTPKRGKSPGRISAQNSIASSSQAKAESIASSSQAAKPQAQKSTKSNDVAAVPLRKRGRPKLISEPPAITRSRRSASAKHQNSSMLNSTPIIEEEPMDVVDAGEEKKREGGSKSWFRNCSVM